MLCTRCQQREAKVWSAEKRAEIEAKLGTPWPFPDDLCKECWREWFQTPEAKQRMDTFRSAMMERFWKDVEKWEDQARSAALRVLDVADALAGKI